MEGIPTPAERIKPYQNDPNRIEVIIDRQSSASFAFDPETKEVVQTGISVDTSSLDITPEQFVGPNRLRNAQERAREYFASRPPVAEEPAPEPGTQYELDLGDQTLH